MAARDLLHPTYRAERLHAGRRRRLARSPGTGQYPSTFQRAPLRGSRYRFDGRYLNLALVQARYRRPLRTLLRPPHVSPSSLPPRSELIRRSPRRHHCRSRPSPGELTRGRDRARVRRGLPAPHGQLYQQPVPAILVPRRLSGGGGSPAMTSDHLAPTELSPPSRHEKHLVRPRSPIRTYASLDVTKPAGERR